MKKAFKYFEDYLRKKKLRLTKQREAIVKQFLAREGHLCTDELYYSLHQKYPRLGYTTVYRTLKLLKAAEMAAEVNFIGKRKSFEHKLDHPHHAHLVCQMCGRVVEFVDRELEKKQEQICRRYRFRGEKQSMKIFGTCWKCWGKQ